MTLSGGFGARGPTLRTMRAVRTFSSSARRLADYSHVVIGGGVVGLAIGAQMARRSGTNVLLLEKNSALAQETSARNSEVIHAGLYYPLDSLKSKLCIRGKELIYEAGRKYGVELQNCGKWVVAQNEKENAYLESLHERIQQAGVPIEWVSQREISQKEPAIKGVAALNSPTTGIVSAHSLMTYLEGVLESNGADVALNTEVVGIAPAASGGYDVTCNSGDDQMTISTDVLINAAGLWAPSISNMLLPPERHFKAYYARGNYFSYTLSQPKVSRLIYPCPSDYGGLGTHLTIDLGGRLKFGPDFEWVDSPTHVDVNPQNLEAAKKEIARYINLDYSALVPDYAGIRPRITSDKSKFHDFVIRHEDGFPGFINLLAIESPGLTSSMAIAEYVESLL